MNRCSVSRVHRCHGRTKRCLDLVLEPVHHLRLAQQRARLEVGGAAAVAQIGGEFDERVHLAVQLALHPPGLHAVAQHRERNSVAHRHDRSRRQAGRSTARPTHILSQKVELRHRSHTRPHLAPTVSIPCSQARPSHARRQARHRHAKRKEAGGDRPHEGRRGHLPPARLRSFRLELSWTPTPGVGRAPGQRTGGAGRPQQAGRSIGGVRRCGCADGVADCAGKSLRVDSPRLPEAVLHSRGCYGGSACEVT